MFLYDYSTMPLDQAINWDPQSILGRALIAEPWRRISESDKIRWLAEMDSPANDDAFISKLIDFECFMLVIIREAKVYAKYVFLDNFQRFTQGPIFEGPYNWPNRI